MQLKDKVIIITGASSGIGAAAALMFAKEGAKLVLGARREKELMTIMGQINQSNGNAICLPGDVCDEGYNRTLVEMAENTYGGLDAGFNNAGTGISAQVPEMENEDWNTVVTTNLTSAFFAAKHQIPAMKRNGAGSIIFTSSVIGYTTAFSGMGANGASKAGVIGLMKNVAVEHGADGIRANAILPGATNTPMLGDLDADPDQKAFYSSLQALKRVADPDEIAGAALFLASDKSKFVTGTAMVVDGGVSINKV